MESAAILTPLSYFAYIINTLVRPIVANRSEVLTYLLDGIQ